jgi:hypothetical protein
VGIPRALNDYLMIELDKYDYDIKGIVILIDVLLDKKGIAGIKIVLDDINNQLKLNEKYKNFFVKREIIIRPLSEYLEESPNLQKLIDNVKESGLDTGCIKPYIYIPEKKILQWADGESKVSNLTKQDKDLTLITKKFTKRKKSSTWVEKFPAEEKTSLDYKRLCPLNKEFVRGR